ncbi:hypothetical protein Ancab_010530 [Ancistrocladus abbreviatus]
MASIWGSFVSLDGATSGKKHFDVAWMLISTSSPRPISGIVPAVVDGRRFYVKVFEETSGETIFSKGFDRDQVPTYSMERQSDPGKTSSNTLVPCSLEETKGGGKTASPTNIIGSDKPVFLNTPDSMDDIHGCRSPLGKSYCMELVAIKIIKHFSAKPPLARYVSCSTIKDRGALMETQTGTIKRKEEKAAQNEIKSPKENGPPKRPELAKVKPRSCNVGESKLGQVAKKEIKSPKEKGPSKRPQLAKVKPRSCNVCRTKSSSRKRSLKPKGSSLVKKGGDSNTLGKGGEDVEISGFDKMVISNPTSWGRYSALHSLPSLDLSSKVVTFADYMGSSSGEKKNNEKKKYQ